MKLTLVLSLFILSCSTKKFVQREIAYEEVFSLDKKEMAKNLINASYDDLKKFSLELIHDCPPDECVVVGLGRSPDPVITFLQEILPGSSFSFPLSSFRTEPSKLPQEKIDLLNNHFDKYFGSLDGNKTKRVVLIDFVASGKGLFSADYFLAGYLEEKGIDLYPIGIPGFDVGHSKNLASESFRGHRKGIGEIRSGGNLESLMHSSSFKSFSVTGGYELYENNPKVTAPSGTEIENRGYFLKELRQKLSSDPEIVDRFKLKTTGSNCLKLLGEL